MAFHKWSSQEFPVLSIDNENRASSFNDWLEEFTIEVKIKIIELGTHMVKKSNGTELEEPVFNEKVKTLTLLRCVGSVGREVLRSVGVDITSDNLRYEYLIQLLKDHFGRSESLFVKTHRFVNVRQMESEDY